MKSKMIHTILPSLIASSIALPFLANAETATSQQQPIITIYQGNIALVQEARPLELNQENSELFLSGISPSANTSSLMLNFTAKEAGEKVPAIVAKKLDRNILSPHTLLDDFVGKQVKILTTHEGQEKAETATILSNNGGIIIQYQDRIELNLPENARIAFDTLPEGLSNTPVLSVILKNLPEKKSPYQANLAYLTGGLNWSTDYIAQLDDSQKILKLEGWATINNSSGLDYQNAKIRLIAGEPNIIRNSIEPRYNMALMASAKMEMMDDSISIPSQSIGDFYLYDIPTISTLKNNEETQLMLFTSEAIPYQKNYHFTNYASYQRESDKMDLTNAEIRISFQNNDTSHLGFPLPSGVIRLYEDSSATTFLGEDLLPTTPNQQTVVLNSGKAFDVTQKRQSTDFKVINEDEVEMSYQLTLSNAKSEAVEVTVQEMIPDRDDLNWEVIDTNNKVTSSNSEGVTWKVTIPANSEKVLTYTIRYTHFKN
ncbi:hypothetical protein DC083_02110 [Ignatzschineria ureiclastica]|uniref:DUF4139 domain-containing protein n=1 Tax=Ignatzschineria ureiclastica TaxID=472582 RepID=A0A2U2AH81_9GAMM|nr:DUF4139 domain-containing protein [Ignatzschineria ureiclastica]PWD82001.1 hypothetical protein DC083_02110 [Ignatzschineria ureiclastica]GGZ91948.1 hypothetical protein GCM10007162_04070 [Ignatzschineria ureiclastica]